MVKQQLFHTIRALPRFHKFMVLALSIVIVLLTALPSDSARASRHSEHVELELGKRYNIEVAQIDEHTPSPALEETKQTWHTFKVKSGDNLAKIFDRAGLSPQDVYKVSKAGKAAKKLLKILPGESLQLLLDENQSFQSLRYPYSKTDTLFIEYTNESYVSRIENKTVSKRLNFATGDIKNSFWNAGIGSGLSDNQIMSLANIFGWDIDFALDIREGDNFNVIFEENYIEGEFVGYGDIIAAEFSNQGETFTAIRYKDGNYYTPAGRSMKKLFACTGQF